MSRSAVVIDEANEPTRDAANEDPAVPLAARSTTVRGRSFHLASIAVALIGLTITAVLAIGTQALHDTNEDRLLHQRVKEAGAVVTAALPAVQTRLAPAAVLAEATDADADSLRNVMDPLVAKGGPYVSVSVWPAAGGTPPRPIIVAGAQPELASETAPDIQRFLAKATATAPLTINDLLSRPERRLGYGYAIPGPNTRYVVYAEAALPKDRRATIDEDSAFADLDYALFLGDQPDGAKLLASSTGGTLVRGRRASDAVPFADTKLLVVMSPQKELGGNLLARLPWILAAVGVVIALAAASLVERLLRRREHAESLARENATLYAEQRTVAQTLQNSLLPDTLPRIAGLRLATRYVAGVEGIDVGGDWYDVMTLDNDRLLFVIGDVSGRGLRAATTMAELRYAIRAYATDGDDPATILTKISRLIDVGREGQFATVLCGSIDVSGHRITLANAGHPDLLVVTDEDAWYADSVAGTPVGVSGATAYTEVTVTVPENATVLAFTDGLVERRGEDLGTGLERLRTSARLEGGSLEDLLTNVLAQTTASRAADDTAILGIQWDK